MGAPKDNEGVIVISALLTQIESYFMSFVMLLTNILEFIGVVIIMISAFKAVFVFFQKDTRFNIKLAEGMSLALEFKLGSEILRTVVVRDWSELALVGAIIALRAILALLIHWEIKSSQSLRNADDIKHTGQS